ncbi:MAG: LAGLIDADG family homing endonuclease [Patescibacteria group bacterium]|nr:LAGLIDADG family homing endonuclease [Patescibacteria group bacterium]
MSPHYLVGLTDGEGCFYFNIRHGVKNRTKNIVAEHHFYIKLRGDYLPLLKKVKAAFGCGGIYFQKETRENHSECYRFGINSRRDMRNVLIPFFDKYPLQSPKQKDYLIFREAVEMIDRREYLSEKGLKKLEKLKKSMNLGVRRVWKIRLLGGNAKER